MAHALIPGLRPPLPALAAQFRLEVLHLLRGTLRAHARLIVAVSGGPDSQALLDLLALLRPQLQLAQLSAVGIDHQLRPEAGAELQLAARLAAAHGVAFALERVHVSRRGNLQAAARRARYAALQVAAQRLGASHIAVGHTLQDQAETLLLQLCRGTGGRGAAAMAVRGGRLLRPLLQQTRAAVMAWVRARGLPYATDPSNANLRFARVRLRVDVAPVLGGLNPLWAQHMGAFCRGAADDEAYLRRRARAALQRMMGPGATLQAAPLRRLAPALLGRALQLWLCDLNVRPQRRHIEALQHLLDADAQRRPCGPTRLAGLDVHLWQGQLVPRAPTNGPAAAPSPPGIRPTTPLKASQLRLRLPIPSAVHLGEHGTLHAACRDRAPQVWATGVDAVAFDAAQLHFALDVRAARPGDRLQPFGFNGRVKVGDLFTNCKIPLAWRTCWPLVLCGEDILWVVGLRRSHHAPITASTRQIVALKVVGRKLTAQDGGAAASTVLQE